MGCSLSKLADVAGSHVYRPAPASFDPVFDTNSIQEPSVKVDTKGNGTSSDEYDDDDKEYKTSTVSDPSILKKLSSPEALDSRDQVSKVMKDLNPALQRKTLSIVSPPPPAAAAPVLEERLLRESLSFYNMEDLEKQMAEPNSKSASEMKRFGLNRNYELRKTDSKKKREASTSPFDRKNSAPVRENTFIKLDRMEMEKQGQQAKFDKMQRNPLHHYPYLCPPGASDSVVLYTTTLRSAGRTFQDDCTRARTILELQRVPFDERDISLHAEFLKELRDMLSWKYEEDGVFNVPKLFVKGRYIGGVDELVELNETGLLLPLLNSAKVERGVGRQGCERCGGIRFVLCFECGGGCKVVVAGKKERCRNCNENGLVHCPACN